MGKRSVNASEIHFVSSIDSKIPEREDGVQSDICEVGYYCRPNPDDSNFLNLYRREDFFLDDQLLKGGTGVLLSSAVQSFVIQYYNGTEWVDLWENIKDEGLPKGIKVEVALKAPSSELLDETESVTFTTVITLPPLYNAKKKEEAPK